MGVELSGAPVAVPGDAAAQLTPVAELFLSGSQVGSAVSSSQLFCSAEIPGAVPDPTGSHGHGEAVKQEAALRAVSLSGGSGVVHAGCRMALWELMASPGLRHSSVSPGDGATCHNHPLCY